jgi:hypothetical protein
MVMSDDDTSTNDPPQQQTACEDDWNLPLDFHLFAQHEKQSRNVEIECVEALTPLDMMHFSAGTHDATGTVSGWVPFS